MEAILVAAALSVSIDLGSLFRRPRAPSNSSRPTCGIQTVSYRFVGEPGTEFHYDGDRYVIPASGSIELIADKRESEYVLAGRKLPLEVWPRDDFGTRTVPVGRVIPSVARDQGGESARRPGQPDRTDTATPIASDARDEREVAP